MSIQDLIADIEFELDGEHTNLMPTHYDCKVISGSLRVSLLSLVGKTFKNTNYIGEIEIPENVVVAEKRFRLEITGD